MSTAECLCVLRGHTGRVSAVALTGDGHKGISVSLDKTLKVWNTDTESRLVSVWSVTDIDAQCS